MDIEDIRRRRQAYNLCDQSDICKGNLGIGRSSMPQIDKSHMDMFLEKLEEHDIDVWRNEHVPADRLHATQGEINSEKVEEMPESKIGKKPLLVSEDNYLLDGHHQWAKAMLINPKMSLLVNKIGLPIKQLLYLTKSFEHTRYKDIDDKQIAAMAKFAVEQRLKTAALELVKIAKVVVAGSSTVNPRFELGLKQAIEEKVDHLQSRADEDKRIRHHGIDLNKFEAEAKSAIQKARSDIQPALTKEFYDFVEKIKASLDDENKIGDVEKLIYKRVREHLNEDNDWKNSTNTTFYQSVLRKLVSALSAFGKGGFTDEAVLDSKKYYEKRADEFVGFCKKFADHLKPIANELDMHLEVSGSVSEDAWLTDKASEPTFYVKIKDTMLSITVFQHGAKYIVEDVIEDPDFFHNTETQEMYDGLIHYLRTGQLPKDKPVKFVRLYRAMSSIEYRKWENGAVIPKNKYFTNKATGDFAYDDPDLAEKLKQDPSFSYGLEQFSVRNDCVVERDSSMFITVKECKFENGKIVPV